MIAWLRRLTRKNSYLAGSPTGSEKPVATFTKDKDEMVFLAFERMAGALHSEEELVTGLMRLRETSVLDEIRKLEEENGHFSDFLELYQMPPSGLRVQWNTDSHSIIYGGHSYLLRRLEALNSLKDSTKAVLVIGSDAAKAEEFRTQGYPTSNQFSTAFDSVYLFLPAEDYAVIGPPLWNDSDAFVYYLKRLSGHFDYRNRIVVIADHKEVILNNFTEPSKDGKRVRRDYIKHDSQYVAGPQKILAVLEPPDQTEPGLIDAFVVAYGGKLLRSGYFLGTKGKTPDQNIWTGDGMGRLLDAVHGLKREWRPFLTHKDAGRNMSLPDVSLRSVEDAARALHVVNRLVEVFKGQDLI